MYQLIVIGGGPAGLAAANAAYEKGLRKILIIERDQELGGILNQCIHSGFGLHFFKEELTGPEYAHRFIEMLKDTNVQVMADTMVLHIDSDRNVYVVNAKDGYQVLTTEAVVLAMGCRERTRGAIAIPGSRPAGIFTAGAAQRFVNIEGYLVGRRVVILGSGDIGLIMARRMTLEGAKVLACVEVNPFPGGLARNIAQCLNDFNIPLYLSHTITDIQGDTRVTGVTIAQVDSHFTPVEGTAQHFDCDTILLSVGLIPENELSRQAGVILDKRTRGPVVYENMETSLPGVFACGNVVHVHDLVDNVTAESQRAGLAAAEYVLDKPADQPAVTDVAAGDGISYTVPQHIRVSRLDKIVNVFFRVRQSFGVSVIQVKDETGQLIAQYARDYMAPGTMESVALPKVLLEKARGGLTITAQAKEADK